MTSLALVRLLQLGSQALPVGGYSHSQGLESAIEHRRVTDEAGVLRWVGGVLEYSMLSFEVPMLLALHGAWVDRDTPAVRALNEEFIATRETAELRAASVQMGFSMRALLPVLPDVAPGVVEALTVLHEPTLPCVFSAVTAAWDIPSRDAAVAYTWSWAENQVLAAIKAVPLGQSAGQRLLAALGRTIAARVPDAPTPGAARTSNFTPALAVLSARHETQYSRLFRS